MLGRDTRETHVPVDAILERRSRAVRDISHGENRPVGDGSSRIAVDPQEISNLRLDDEAVIRANENVAEGYKGIADLIDKLAEAAIGDFMD